MASIVLDALGYYEIADKLLCMTTDGAANNSTLAECLEEKLAELGISWDHEVTFPKNPINIRIATSIVSPTSSTW